MQNTLTLTLDDKIVKVPSNITTKYNLIGRQTRDSLYNKKIIDSSNDVRANRIGQADEDISIVGGGAPGNVLVQLSSTSAGFRPFSAGYSVVRLNAVSIIFSGGLWYITWGPAVDIIGTSSVTLVPALPALVNNSGITSTRYIYSAQILVCLQYSSQPAGVYRTFMNLRKNGVPDVSCADGVPGSTNNWRVSRELFTYGIEVGDHLGATLDTNTSGSPTLNDATVFLQLM
jgi:hypothetical protein